MDEVFFGSLDKFKENMETIKAAYKKIDEVSDLGTPFLADCIMGNLKKIEDENGGFEDVYARSCIVNSILDELKLLDGTNCLCMKDIDDAIADFKNTVLKISDEMRESYECRY